MRAVGHSGGKRQARGWALAALASSCAPVQDAPRPAAAHAPAPFTRHVGAAGPALGTPLDGRAFPDHVLALTWDDGPDTGTLALARYLKRERVSATFFVVGAWLPGASSDPGDGDGVFATGADAIAVLSDVVRLGHRLGNHTENHAMLWDAPASVVRAQVLFGQRRLDPLLGNELALFRAPGGAWSAAAGGALEEEEKLAGLVGPVRWDVDAKDWEASLDCVSERPATECEPAGPHGRLRVRPAVVAARYLAAIESAGRGIVLLHDRVGHVGSSYALAVAEALVPPLRARGYVFAAPVLRFSPLRARFAPAERGGDGGGSEARAWNAVLAAGPWLADADGDGRADLCGRSSDGVVCARAERGPVGDHARPEVRFGPLARVSAAPPGPSEAAAPSAPGPDLNGDGRADACAAQGGAIVCALRGDAGLTAGSVWAAAADVPELAQGGVLLLGDVSGDGRADACVASPAGVRCGMAP